MYIIYIFIIFFTFDLQASSGARYMLYKIYHPTLMKYDIHWVENGDGIVFKAIWK